MKLIDPNVVTYHGSISDDELKRRLTREALEQAGCLDAEGKPLKGVTTAIRRDGGRAGNGKWLVTVTRDLRLSDQARLPKPEGAG